MLKHEQIIRATKFTSPTGAHCVQHEVTNIKVIMSLMSLILAGFHGNIQPVFIRPAATHGAPLVKLVVKEAVQLFPIPESTGDTGIIPEHAPWVCSIALVALVKSILRFFPVRSVKHHGVGCGRELVWAVIAPVKEGSGTLDVHVEVAGFLEIGVGIEQSVVRAGGGDQRRGHLGVARGTEIPIVGCFSPSTIVRDGLSAVCFGIVDGEAQEGFCSTGRVVAEDRKGTQGQSTVADAVPLRRMRLVGR